MNIFNTEVEDLARGDTKGPKGSTNTMIYNGPNKVKQEVEDNLLLTRFTLYIKLSKMVFHTTISC